MTRRSAFTLKTALIILPMLLIVAGFYVWQQVVSGDSWRFMEREVQTCLAAADQRDRNGPSLKGLPRVQGNRWDDYASAFKAVQGADQSVLNRFIYEKDASVLEDIRKLLRERVAALDLLQKAVAKGAGSKPRIRTLIEAIPATGEFKYQQGIERVTPIHQLGFLGICHARLSSPEEALGLLIDLLQFASDLGRDGLIAEELGAFVVLDQTCQDLSRHCASSKVTPTQLLTVSRVLEAMDRDFFDHGHILLNELASIGSSLLAGNYKTVTFGEQDKLPVIPSLEDKLSRRRAVAEAFLRVASLYHRYANASRGLWSNSVRLDADLEEQAATTPSPFERLLIPGSLSTERDWRKRRAQLRLLRIEIEFIASGKILSLSDPFGPGDLRVESSGSTLRAWSRGIDGEDDGGAEPSRNRRTSDIVINVTRP